MRVSTTHIGVNGEPAASLVTIEWVTVGNPGNASDTANHCYATACGSVAETFRISKFETTNAQ